jgi:hypothetical protein
VTVCEEKTTGRVCEGKTTGRVCEGKTTGNENKSSAFSRPDEQLPSLKAIKHKDFAELLHAEDQVTLTASKFGEIWPQLSNANSLKVVRLGNNNAQHVKRSLQIKIQLVVDLNPLIMREV